MIENRPLGFAFHLRETWWLAAPVVVGQLGNIAINQADTIMVGSLGSTHLAAATLANGVWIFFTIVGMGILSAVGPLTAQWSGAGKENAQMGRILNQSLLLSLAIGVLLCLLQFGVVEFLHLMSQPHDVVILAKPYLRIIALSSIPMLGFLAAKNYVDGFEKTWPGMLVMGFMVALNVGLNWVLIHGHLGFPALGLDGAGWATLLSRLVGFALMLVFIGYFPALKGMLKIREVFRVDSFVLREIFKIGLPAGMQYFFEVGAFVGAVILAGWIGEDALSAHQIAMGVASVTFMFYLGFSIAASIRVGNAMGRNDKPAMRLAGWAGFAWGALAICIFVAGMVALRNQIPSLYIQDANVIELTVPLLVIGAMFQLFDGIQAIGIGVLRGMSDVKIPTASTFLAYWVIGLPLAYVFMLPLGFGLEGIWYGLTIGLAVSAIAMIWRFYWKTRP